MMSKTIVSMGAALAFALSGCAWGQPPQGTIILPHPTIQGATMEIKADSMMIGIAAVEYVRTLNTPARSEQVADIDDCSRHQFSNAATECERRLGNRELIEYGGGGAKKEPVPLTAQALEQQTRYKIAKLNFWSNIIGAGIGGVFDLGTTYVAQRESTKRHVASEKSWQVALEEFGKSGGTSFGEVLAGGNITFTQADDGSVVAGNDANQPATGGGIAVGGSKSDTFDSDGVTTGFPAIECAGPGEICVNNDERDNVSSNASLL